MSSDTSKDAGQNPLAYNGILDSSEEKTFCSSSESNQKPGIVRSESLTSLDELERRRQSLNKQLKERHLKMMAMSSAIGTGLFVVSGAALEVGGPAPIFISIFLITILMYTTIQAMAELAVAFPVMGSFTQWGAMFLDESWGFSMAWNYNVCWLLVYPLELVVASMIMDYWHIPVHNGIWVPVFSIIILGVNCFGVVVYGETEFIVAIIKVVAVIGFIILGIAIDCGSGQHHMGYIGVKYWRDPGAFNNGFKGACAAFCALIFSFSGTELVGLTAAESENPSKAIPSAVKQLFWRIALFYVASLFIVSLLVPFNALGLQARNNVDNAIVSPFVLAIQLGETRVCPSIFNGVILMSVISVGNSAVYASSRITCALADQGMAPRIFSKIDRKGRPVYSLLFSAAFGLLAFLVFTGKQAEIFTWLLATSGLSSLFNWLSICICHIRFRRALKLAGRSTSDLVYSSWMNNTGSYIGIFLTILVLAANFYLSFSPLTRDTSITYEFFKRCLTIPVMCVFFAAHRVFFKGKFVKLQDIDLSPVDIARGTIESELYQEDDEDNYDKKLWSRLRIFASKMVKCK